MVRETAREAHMFRFQKPETPRAALLLFLGNETGAKSGFVSYVSLFLGFDFDPTSRSFSSVGGVYKIYLLYGT